MSMVNVRELLKNPGYKNPFGINDPSLDESVRQEAMRTAATIIEDCKTVFNMYNSGIIEHSDQAEAQVRSITRKVNAYGDVIKQFAPEFHAEMGDYFKSAQGVYYNLKHAETLPKVHRLGEGNYSSSVLKEHPLVNSPIPFPTPLEMRDSFIPGQTELISKFKSERADQAEIVNKLSYIHDRKQELEEGRKEVMKKIATGHYDEISPDQLDDHAQELQRHLRDVDETNRELAALKKEMADFMEAHGLTTEDIEGTQQTEQTQEEDGE